MNYRTIISGSRSCTELRHIYDAVKASGFFPSVVISGTCRGPDRFGEEWAKANGVPIERFPADWDQYGKQAGYIRNVDMACHAEALIAVWDGESNGTRHMINAARAKGLKIFVYMFKEEAERADMKFDDLEKECLACQKCKIGGQVLDGKPATVLSNGNIKAKIMVVGQNPGRDEVSQHTPFIGISGKIFDECLEANTVLKREDLYICNSVCCFTPENRKPTELEFQNCSDFLLKQIDLVKPVVVVTLGGVALRAMTGLNGITKYHAKPVFSYKYKVTVFPLLHPSPLNTNRPEKKKEFCDGLKALNTFIANQCQTMS